MVRRLLAAGLPHEASATPERRGKKDRKKEKKGKDRKKDKKGKGGRPDRTPDA